MMSIRHLGVTGLGLAILLGGAGCSKRSASTTSTGATTAAAATAGAMAANPASASDGAGVYTTDCSSCHQTAGTGVAGAFPALAGNPIVQGDPTRVIYIVKFGLTGKVVVNGQTYNGMMPHWAQMISNADIASVVTYIRSAWGNKASPVSLAQVEAVQR